MALVAANLIPLYGVLALDWPVFPLMLLFWLENVVIGVLNVARIVCASPHDAGQWFLKILLVPFFCVHYGGFCAAHGFFVIAAFGSETMQSTLNAEPSFEPLLEALRMPGVALALAALSTSHLISFAVNYLGRGEYREVAAEALMVRPYGRIVVLHVVIIIGGGIAMALHSPLWALLMLVALKIAMDLRAHLAERRRLGSPRSAPPAGA
jgi:membrane glycosyltransferase